jgi:hypothetical protein
MIMKRFLVAIPIWTLLASPVLAQAISVPNDTTTGTVIGQLAKIVVNGTTSKAITPLTTDVASVTPMGVVIGWGNFATSGTTGNALIATGGLVQCTFDAGGVTSSHAVINSAATVGLCKDGGVPPNVNAVGYAQQTVASGVANMIAISPFGR